MRNSLIIALQYIFCLYNLTKARGHSAATPPKLFDVILKLKIILEDQFLKFSLSGEYMCLNFNLLVRGKHILMNGLL